METTIKINVIKSTKYHIGYLIHACLNLLFIATHLQSFIVKTREEVNTERYFKIETESLLFVAANYFKRIIN